MTTLPKSQDKKLSTSVCVDTEGSHDSCRIKISQSNGDRFKIVYTVKMYWLTQNKRIYLNTYYSIGSVLESDYFLQKTQLIVTKEIHSNCRCGYRCRTHNNLPQKHMTDCFAQFYTVRVIKWVDF